MNTYIVNYYIYIYLFLYPILSPFIPDVSLGMIFNSERLFLIPIFFSLLLYIFTKSGKILISKVSLAIITYYIYTLINMSFQGNFHAGTIFTVLLFLSSIILLDNLTFSEKHLIRFNNVIIFLGLISFCVIMVQYLYMPNFYIGKGSYQEYNILAFSNTYRYQSIFSAFKLGVGWLCSAYIFLIYLYSDYPRLGLIKISLLIIFLISIILTFTRSVMLIPIVAVYFYFYYNNQNNKLLRSIPVVLLLLVIIYSVYNIYLDSNFIQERILSKSYIQRFNTLGIFFDKYFDTKILFGWGERNVYEIAYNMQRKSGVLNGFIQSYITSGLIGLLLFLNIFKHLYQRGKTIYKATSNPILLIFVYTYILINFTASYDNILSYPFFIVYLYISIISSVTRHQARVN